MEKLLAFVFLLLASSPVLSFPNGLALTPPMGWSTWNTFACDIQEDLIKEVADALVSSGLAKAGYTYVNIDDCWMANKRDPVTERLVPDPQRFPSGIKALSQYMHDRGLKLGIYFSSGNLTCQRFPGSWGLEEIDAQTAADWGVDFVKLDCCYMSSQKDRQLSYSKFSKALALSGRPIVFSCDTDELLLRQRTIEQPWKWGPSTCHMARMWWDINDQWSTTLSIIDQNVNLEGYAGPGFWNDMDILTVGMGNQSMTEYKSQFLIWCILNSPLIAGNDVRKMSSDVLMVLTAEEVIAVNQDPRGIQGRRVRVSESGGQIVFAKPIGDAKLNQFAVVIFNRADTAVKFDFQFKADLYANFLCCPPPIPHISANVRDLWLKQDLGVFKNTISVQLQAHDSIMLKISPLSPQSLKKN